MFLTVHASIGALLGDVIDEPYVAGFAGMLSHFIFDAVPHGDERIEKYLLAPERKRWVAALFILDALTALAIVTLFYASGITRHPAAFFTGALGAVLPDVLDGCWHVSRKKFLPDFHTMHDAAHRFLKHPIHPVLGYIVQVSLFILVWLLVVWL
ncbi:MAG: hypothetical protein WC052_03390 [Patescibacteria group bacterium]|jgi:hypothetical protein